MVDKLTNLDNGSGLIYAANNSPLSSTIVFKIPSSNEEFLRMGPEGIFWHDKLVTTDEDLISGLKEVLWFYKPETERLLIAPIHGPAVLAKNYCNVEVWSTPTTLDLALIPKGNSNPLCCKRVSRDPYAEDGLNAAIETIRNHALSIISILNAANHGLNLSIDDLEIKQANYTPYQG
jgi:hypothetical protein